MTNSTEPHKVHAGLPPDLLKRLRDTLKKCPEFSSNERLRAIFTDARIVPWANGVPEASDLDARVSLTIRYLYKDYDTNDNSALVLLLRVLHDHVHPNNDLNRKLSVLVDEVEASLEGEQSQSTFSASSSHISFRVETAALRVQLKQLDAVEIESLCLDHFPEVYDKFGRGLRRDEMINLLLDYVRRWPEEAAKLSKLLKPLPPPNIPETILIPAGEFWMGSEPSDRLASDREIPCRKLNLLAYAIGKYPVANAEYLTFARANPHHTPDHWVGGQIPAGKENHPVVNVSWWDAQSYCRWLTKETGEQYRLPTEEEWEKAARGSFPETRRYPWKGKWDQCYVNTESAGYGDTTSVAAFEDKNVSSFGVVDMVGNVWEWTMTSYTKERYIVRGGAWDYPNWYARVSCRGRDFESARKANLGFRVARILGG